MPRQLTEFLERGKEMKCPYCGSEDTRVSDSRPVEENNSIRRRRVCDACKRRFTTYEKIETIPMVVIKKDNNREPYDRSKIEGGILRACHKRPVSVNQIKRVVDEIEKAWIRSPMSALPLYTVSLRMSALSWRNSGNCSSRKMSAGKRKKPAGIPEAQRPAGARPSLLAHHDQGVE